MRHLHATVSFIAAGIMATAGFAQAGNTGDKTASQSGSQQNQPAQQSAAERTGKTSADNQSQQAPEGFVIVDEQLITLTANEPQNHFLRAKEYLAHNDARAAAAEVRIAAGYLDMQASRKGEADQQGLRSESRELRQLADQIQPRHAQSHEQAAGQTESKEKAPANGNSNSSTSESAEQKRLDEAFAKADRVLAQHFQEEAKNELGKNKGIRAGEDLDAAASALVASIAWSGAQCSKECTQSVADAQRVSDELLSVGERRRTGADSNRQQSENVKADAAKNTKDSNAENGNEAQPASARLSGESDQGASQNARIPADAEKVVDELGKAIDSHNTTAQPGQNQPSQQSNQKHEGSTGAK
ncbi:MAG TPA: hypothetical protein VG326_07380 [Tepidisphaeraceae bacterium]|jgi:hypothetical protein|nr:hypothetical protein [Tepidisphaeraceae bacterium]